MNRKRRRDALLNGVSVSKIELDQEGNLTVTFDLPVAQDSCHYELSLTGSRTFDVYECPELGRLARDLFAAIRKRLLAKPDEVMAANDCTRCKDAACCRNYNVLVTEEDIDRLRGAMPRQAFLAAYTTSAVDWSGDYSYQLKCDKDGKGEKCIFLRADKRGRMRCAVYERRPKICRDFDMAICPDWAPL